MKRKETERPLRKHLTGGARFVDDQIPRRGMLEVWPVVSPLASALLTRRDAAKARKVDGVRAVLFAADVPGLNHIGAIRDDEPLFAGTNVFFCGQLVGLVVGESREVCRRAAALGEVEYQRLPAVLTIEQAIAISSFHTDAQEVHSGDCDGELHKVARKIKGTVSSGGQEHFYLETQVAWAEPMEGSEVCVHVSSQHPSQIQALVADVLGCGKSEVRVVSHRVGGGFGGKETQAHSWAALAALASAVTRAPVRVCLDRRQDMALTGKRHAFYSEYEAGFEKSGRLRAVKISMFANGGWSLDLSETVVERALLHLDGVYDIPNTRFSGIVCKTNLVSNTSCLGTGAVEATLVIEEILDRIAEELNLPADEVRGINLYGRGGNGTQIPCGQPFEAGVINSIWEELLRSSGFRKRSKEITLWNEKRYTVKRGIAIVPVKLGAGFTVRTLNQGAALVNVLTDGSVQINHGGVESGQGIDSKMRAVASCALGIEEERIRVLEPSTEKVPNTSATASSISSDINGRAVRNACETIVERMRPIAAQLLHKKGGPICELADLVFADGRVSTGSVAKVAVDIRDVIFHCWRNRISLSATGYSRTESGILDRGKGEGSPFDYFIFGAAVAEVEIDGHTGQCRILRADLLSDGGVAPDLTIDRGQIEGGFVMGTGWLTSEELLWDREGVLWTDSPTRYKIPTIGDLPVDFRVSLYKDADETGEQSGEVRDLGEVGVVMAISVREAMKNAVGAFGYDDRPRELDAPATPESVYRAIAARGGWASPRVDKGTSTETPVAGESKISEPGSEGRDGGGQPIKAAVVPSGETEGSKEAMPLKRLDSELKAVAAEEDSRNSDSSASAQIKPGAISGKGRKGRESRDKGANVSAGQ